MTRRQSGARPAGLGGLLLWLLLAMLLMTASPASAGCPFRHGLRFAAPRLTKDLGQHAAAHAAFTASSSTQARADGMHVSRRLQGIIGEVDQSQTLTKDVVVTNPPTTTLKPVNTPYTVNPYGTATRPTNPLHKDWASVVSACKTIGQVELRMNNFFIRACFHDGMAVVADCPTCSGLDASLLINATEILRPENDYEHFATTTARAILKISRWFKVSASDALAVCCAVATETLGGPPLFGPERLLRVGRLDSTTASTPGQLPGEAMTAAEFAAWWPARGFTVEEGVALMGSHALLDEQTCYRGRGGNPRDYCNPAKELCHDIRMFSWKNHYYVDACTPSVKVVPDNELPEVAAYEAVTDADIFRTDTVDELRADLRREICKWSSPERRAAAQQMVLDIRRGKKVTIPKREPATAFFDAAYRKCKEHADNPLISANCNHPQTWFYTLNDANLAAACQADISSLSTGEARIKKAMRTYLDQDAWNAAYTAAFHKMVNTYANFRNDPTNKQRPVLITGTECASGYATNRAGFRASVHCNATACPLRVPKAASCPAMCTCKTTFGKARRARALATNPDTLLPTTPEGSTPKIWVPPPDGVIGPGIETEQPEPIMVADVNPTSMPGEGSLEPPKSPYGGSEICPAANGSPYSVDGYPGSPFLVKPFQVTYDKSVLVPLEPKYTTCRPKKFTPDGQARHCMQVYDITVEDIKASLWDATIPGCDGKTTQLLAYGGRVPGPTIRAPAGHQVLVRFRNKINEGALDGEQHWPCVETRRGRPISIHLHGSASLAPYDGWADDVTCGGESKDYIYPNQRPTTAWYHDHGIHVTGDNAYHGLAGWYIISGKKADGGCGEPYNLEHIPERLVMLSDKVLDSNCQLYYNHEGPHRNNIYGDINMVNGQPWPNMPLDAGWVRFRFLNAAMVRPYLIKIKDSKGADVADKICHIIATDGGYRVTPVRFPEMGLQMGVAERYEVVCNFADYAGQTLYLWNGRNEGMMKSVPYFCYSHLIARIQVGAQTALRQSAPPPPEPTPGTGDLVAQPGPGPTTVEAPAPTPAPPPPPVAEVVTPAPNPTPDTTPPPPVEQPLPQPDPLVDPGLQAAAASQPAGLKSSEDVAAAPVGRRLLGARAAATVASAAGAAGVAAMAAGSEQAGVFDPTMAPDWSTAINRVLSKEDVAAAWELIRQDKPHRTFKFGRRNGHWVINGETWDTAMIAADDVGHNTWELWYLKTGGGWFHPIHMHLVDFYVLKRGDSEGPDGLFEYERDGPKDVVYLGPSQRIWLIARFGAHRGSYMFHCHNLVHEDYDMLRAMTIISRDDSTSQTLTARNAPTEMVSLIKVAGVVYDTYGDPMVQKAAAKPDGGELTDAYCDRLMRDNLYRIYYPATSDEQYDLLISDANPWRAPVCPLPPKKP